METFRLFGRRQVFRLVARYVSGGIRCVHGVTLDGTQETRPREVDVVFLEATYSLRSEEIRRLSVIRNGLRGHLGLDAAGLRDVSDVLEGILAAAEDSILQSEVA